jgi:hypothetical protein
METLLTAIPGCKALDKAASLQDTFELSWDPQYNFRAG